MTTPQSQCTNLELSKKLKELGYPQESLFYWVYGKLSKTYNIYSEKNMLGLYSALGYTEIFAAPTVAELGRYMPISYLGDLVSLMPYKTIGGKWRVDLDDEGMLCSEDTEADARAKMLIYLLENKLIEL